MSQADKVLFELLPSNKGYQIGIATLNKPQALNALDSDMIQLLMPQLLQWQTDPSVCMVMLDSQLDKAFCAGGDVVAMYHAMANNCSEHAPALLQDFFTHEYQLDYLIHTYAKPIVVWGHGIVMGGGLGLMAGASHRIVTASSRIAMPEISIGLYPDVGGSYFLNQMPKGCGLFLGLTGASINAADALYSGLADYFIPQLSKQVFLAQLVAADWQSQAQANHILLDELCAAVQNKQDMPAGQLVKHQAILEALANINDVSKACQLILAQDSNDDTWLMKAQRTLQAGSPITKHLVMEQLKRGAQLHLADCFRMELGMSCRCGELGEFQEGVRALLVDKDNAPQWLYQDVDAVPANIIDSFFTSSWPAGSHPLADLA